MYNDLYKFRFEEMKELTFNELKIFARLRQQCKGKEKIIIQPIAIADYFGLCPDVVRKAIVSLQRKGKLRAENHGKSKIIYIDDVIEDGEEYNFFVMKDFDSEKDPIDMFISWLTYNEFKIFSTVRSYSRRYGFASLSRDTMSEKTGIDKSNLGKVLDSLEQKGIVSYDKVVVGGITRNYWVIDDMWNYVEVISTREDTKSLSA